MCLQACQVDMLSEDPGNPILLYWAKTQFVCVSLLYSLMCVNAPEVTGISLMVMLVAFRHN